MNETNAINLAWLIKLRWGAAVGQAALILLVYWGVGLALPLAALLTIIGIALASNAACARWIRRSPDIPGAFLGLVMLTDVVLLTGLLYFTGGPLNPFSFLYLVNIALAAVVLQPRWTWALVVVSLGCYGALFFDHVSLPLGQHEGHAHHMSMHLQGMWVAFGVTAGFIAYFIQRITRALAHRDADLATARAQTARQERLASLATLAAGATHELATPLSTIAVVARELERQLEKTADGAGAVEDARLIRQEVARCREILVQLAADAGESTGEAFAHVSLGDLVQSTVAALPDREGIRVTADDGVLGRTVCVPPRALAQALKAVVKNARQASPAGAEVLVHVAIEGDSSRIEVRDRGNGMTPEVVARAVEPFFTTKDGTRGVRGMGLGLFLSRTILERIGGALDLDSEPGRGTTARIRLSLERPTAVQATERADGAPLVAPVPALGAKPA